MPPSWHASPGNRQPRRYRAVRQDRATQPEDFQGEVASDPSLTSEGSLVRTLLTAKRHGMLNFTANPKMPRWLSQRSITLLPPAGRVVVSDLFIRPAQDGV